MKTKNSAGDKNQSTSISLPLLFGKTQSSQFSITLSEKIVGSWEIEPKIKNCMICWKTIKKGEDLVRCKSCHNRFHKDHWKDWIKKKKLCPVCKTKP